MMEDEHRKILWVHILNVVLGVWLVTSPVTFGYQNGGMLWSGIISGALLVVFGLLSLNAHRLWAPWAACFVGLWVSFAPLVFWSSSPAAYVNDTLVGALVVAFSVLVPGMPGMMMFMKPGPEIPPGWTYNPSAWLQRAPIIALAFVGWFGSRYLAAYQLGYIPHAWDPFFGNSTVRVLTSDVSRAWPISDAGLGAFSYTIEVLMGFMGGTDRWRTMPWMVTFFGILVIPLGATSIVLVILQPVAVGAWCTLCLLTALAMLIMIPLTLDEVVAMIQFLVQAKREGKPFWRTFWKGDTVKGGGPDKRTPQFNAALTKTAPAMVWGANVPLTLLLSAALGTWLMFVPAVLHTQGAAADSDHLVGALVITFAVIAMAEVGRTLRFINILFGAWIVLAPWVLTGSVASAKWNNVITGVAVILLSFPRGKVRDRYGSWQPYIV
jgi:uncharacterized membrane protein